MTANLNPNIFLSYSWANTDIADEIDKDFESIGIQFRRDVRDAEYRTSIKEFMHQIGQSDFVLMIVSDEYLRSENCMYEVTELLNTHEFEKRILPIVLDNGRHIFKPLGQEVYYDYWLERKKKADRLKRKHVNEVSIEYAKKCQNIQDNIPKFFQKITDLNVSTYEELKRENYRALLKIVGFREELLMEEVLRISKVEDIELQELELEELLEKHPQNNYAMFQKAYIADTNKQFKKAKYYYERVIEIDPRNAVTYFNLALVLKNEFEDYEGAKRYYEEAILIDSKYADAHINLAVLFEDKLSNYEAAKHHYEEAIGIDPAAEDGYYNLALLMEKHFLDFDNAVKYYKEALNIDPNQASVHNNLAILLAERFNDIENAKSHYEQAIAIDPQHANAHNNLAVLLEEFYSDFEKAKYHYEEAVRISPEHQLAKNNLDTLLKKQFEKYPGKSELGI